MASVGLIQSFIIIQLAHSLQLIFRWRTELPPSSLILLATLVGIWIAMTLVYFLAFKYLFYAVSLLYLSQTIVLYTALFYLLAVMQQCASTNYTAFSALSEERDKLGKVVGVFGFAYIIGTLTSSAKAFYLEEIEHFLQEQTAIYYLCTFASNLVIDIMPISTIYMLHKSNFENPVERASEPREDTSVPNSHPLSGGSAESIVSNAIDGSNNCGLLGACVQS